MYLGRQGVPLRGHSETMTDSCNNTENVIEALKLLSIYDAPLQEHLGKVVECQSASRPSGRRGRGSVLTFLSYESQNKLIMIMNKSLAQLLKQYKIAELGLLWQTQHQTLSIMSS